jgi:hypothetical protein
MVSVGDRSRSPPWDKEAGTRAKNAVEISTIGDSELAKATASLETSKEKMVQKIEELEEKLFQMDLEYEGQTAKFQKEYDERKNVEVERISEKI